MRLLDPTFLMDNCDYSFGNLTGANMYNGHLRPANIGNQEFLSKCEALRGNKEYMTLFIDNIRLYRREGIRYTNMENPGGSNWQYNRSAKNDILQRTSSDDLLNLCSQLPDMKFVIFVGFEDSSIDEFIFDKIPSNVIAIYSSNCISFGGKVRPIPFGIPRRASLNDKRQEVTMSLIDFDKQPVNLCYINHSLGANPERPLVNEFLSNKSWVTISGPTTIAADDYRAYLMEIKDHKFMVCVDGNAIGCECYRNWETLYMRRVPIVKRSPYMEKIFEGFPVLFVDEFTDITEDLLISNDHLYQEALNLDMSKLDMDVLYNKIISDINLDK